jgi:demethylmenaquinone methyltransferase/2-methoxy-6-polyprenyl-1,4-benzoquinol methylase
VSHEIDHSFGEEDVSPEERQRRIRGLFDRIARRYDLMNDMMSFGIHRAWKRSFIRDLPNNGVFVDLAGGTGDVAALAAKTPGRQVVVCDPSQEMMQVGRERLGPSPLTWVAGVGERLPFPSSSVSALTVAFGLRNVTHLRDALAEAHRVLKPNGIFACLEFSRPLAWFRPFYDAYSCWIIPRLGALVAAEPAAYTYLVESIRRFPDQEAFAELLREAGFKDVSYRNVSLGIACIHRARR